MLDERQKIIALDQEAKRRRTSYGKLLAVITAAEEQAAYRRYERALAAKKGTKRK